MARTPEQVAVAEHKTFQLLAYSATEVQPAVYCPLKPAGAEGCSPMS